MAGWKKRMTESKLETLEHKYFAGTGSMFDEEGRPIVYGDARTHKLVNINQAEGYKQLLEQEAEYAKNQENQQAFTFSDMEAIKEVSSVLTTQQCGLLLMLQCFIEFNTGLIVKTGKKPMTQADMARKLNVSRQTVNDFIRVCEENEIIIDSDLGYILNPRYHFKGSTDNPKVIRTYIARLREVYDEIDPVDLGHIYRMLPYVHLTTNFLCVDPYADVREIEVMSRKQLAEVLELRPETVSRLLGRLKFGGEAVCAKITVEGETGYCLNPTVFWRAGKQPDETLIAMFRVGAKKKRK